MPDDDLTAVQRYVLVTLMLKASALPNTFLTNVAKIGLKPDKRTDLKNRELITVTEKPLVLELTEKGWKRAIEEMGAEVPPRGGSAGGTLYLALGFLREYLDHTGMAPAELFTLRRTDSADAAPADLENAIRKAYAELATRAGDYVPLAPVRGALGTASREDVDSTLVEMSRTPGVHIIPNSQQGDLTAEDRAAAVTIGGQEKHLIAIGS